MFKKATVLIFSPIIFSIILKDVYLQKLHLFSLAALNYLFYGSYWITTHNSLNIVSLLTGPGGQGKTLLWQREALSNLTCCFLPSANLDCTISYPMHGNFNNRCKFSTFRFNIMLPHIKNTSKSFLIHVRWKIVFFIQEVSLYSLSCLSIFVHPVLPSWICPLSDLSSTFSRCSRVISSRESFHTTYTSKLLLLPLRIHLTLSIHTTDG